MHAYSYYLSFNPLPNGAVSAPGRYIGLRAGGGRVSIPFLTGPCLLLLGSDPGLLQPVQGFNPLPNGAVSAPSDGLSGGCRPPAPGFQSPS